MPKKQTVVWLAIALGVVVLAVLGNFIFIQPASEKDMVQVSAEVTRTFAQISAAQKAGKLAEEKASQELAAIVAADEAILQAEKEQKLADFIDAATVRKGEGIEHSFIRQLTAYPQIVEGVTLKIGEKDYDLTYQGDEDDAKAVKKWAGRTAHLIAIFAGYADKTGKQVRVKAADKVAYGLFQDTNSDGLKTATVMVYSKKTDEQNQAPAFQLEEEPDYQLSVELDFASVVMFQAAGLEKYEYMRK